ncbi:MAG: rRNA synthase [Deferribacteres bacterium]|jgi:23S rRNA pseudouridine1911/1915/1917 synthase|nr:ribosomal large subunit pseudouridine synthase [Deferribacteraceae bacterium]MDK2792516.1 rRNA synthase [Deferribacteres bacterium]
MKKIVEELKLVADKDYKRADIFLSEKTGKTRSFCQKLVELELVSLNGKVLKKTSTKINQGDYLVVSILEEEKPNLEPKKIDFEIVFEHKEYLIINKPAGIVVHPAPGNYSNTLVNGLVYMFSFEINEGDFRPGIIHRLDKDTSGLMIVAKNYNAKERLSKLFKERDLEKRYICIAYGSPKENFYNIENHIGRHKINRKKMCVNEDGKFAKTDVFILKRFKNEFIADVKIYTGRTHQIRVHMSFLGFPIIGDEVYGNKFSLSYPIKRQALHSYYLKFICPFDNIEREVNIDLPEDMQNLIDCLN